MRIRFVDETRLEFLDAISYYNKQQPKLGQRFKVEVEQSILWLAEHVEACKLRPGGYRRLNLRVFPYYIPYVVRGISSLDSCRCSQKAEARILDSKNKGLQRHFA
jgi:hypothetical protein